MTTELKEKIAAYKAQKLLVSDMYIEFAKQRNIKFKMSTELAPYFLENSEERERVDNLIGKYFNFKSSGLNEFWVKVNNLVQNGEDQYYYTINESCDGIVINRFDLEISFIKCYGSDMYSIYKDKSYSLTFEELENWDEISKEDYDRVLELALSKII